MTPGGLCHCCVGQRGVRSGRGTHEAGAPAPPREGVQRENPQCQERACVLVAHTARWGICVCKCVCVRWREERDKFRELIYKTVHKFIAMY